MSQPPAKQTSSTSSKVAKPLSSHVSVYNSTLGVLDQNFFVDSNDPKIRPSRERVIFKPGNNRVLRSDWDRCMNVPSFRLWTVSKDAYTPSGHKYPLIMLELGKKVDHSKEEAGMQRKIDKVREDRQELNY